LSTNCEQRRHPAPISARLSSIEEYWPYSCLGVSGLFVFPWTRYCVYDDTVTSIGSDIFGSGNQPFRQALWGLAGFGALGEIAPVWTLPWHEYVSTATRFPRSWGAFGPRRRQPDYIARSDRCDVRRLVEIHYDASREAKRSVPAALQSRSARRERRTRITDEQAITSRGCEVRSPCARRGLDGDGLGDPDRDPMKEGGTTKCEMF
jgi:hypothetical protein